MKGFELTDHNGFVNRENRADTGRNGMVAAAKYDATKIGIDIIRSGGNAIDAAVAVGFALGVCEPNASGIGGGGFMTIRTGTTGEIRFLDFRETAPKKVSPLMWQLDSQREVVEDAKSQGGESICIPGEVDGLIYALETYGTLPLKEVLMPAIRLAENGFKVTEGLKNDLSEFRDKLLRYQETGNVFLDTYQVGDILTNKPLAETLKAIAVHGKQEFYHGKIAEQIVRSVRHYGGRLELEDLMAYRVQELEPLRGTYRGYEIISSPLPSSGGTHIIQSLNVLENFDMGKYPVNSVEYLHLLSEVFKMVFDDRKKYMGDPNFVKVPMKGLVSKAYARELATKISMSGVSQCDGSNPFEYESKDTTHYSIADQAGNMVSVTKTISAFFGSGVIPENTGVVLNCQMRGFVRESNQVNSVGPGKKPLSSMSPTLVMKEGHPFAVLGSPGGNRIITTIVQVISKLIDHQMTIKEAINSPRISNDSNGVLNYERRISRNVIDELMQLGHAVSELSEYDRRMGGVQGIRYGEDGNITGAADPRREGIAIGY